MMKPRAGGEYGMDMDGLGRIDSAHCSGVAVEGVDAALERGEAALDAEVDGVGVAEAVADDEAGDERRVDRRKLSVTGWNGATMGPAAACCAFAPAVELDALFKAAAGWMGWFKMFIGGTTAGGRSGRDWRNQQEFGF